MPPILTGLDRVQRDGLALPGRGRAALLCNATTVSRSWEPTPRVIAGLTNVRLERILSPQHGFATEKQDNMIASADGMHPELGVPIISLYGERCDAHPADLVDVDALIIDLPDVGTRVYTFLITALSAMQAAAQVNLPVFVLDRPNPIGGGREGPLLDEDMRSFVGRIDVPLRHGLTPGEYCAFGAAQLGLPDAAQGFLHPIALEGWRRAQYFDETGLPWTMPSPNLPTLAAAIVYPGQVILEGTQISEGRGTTRPFELFGAPYLDPRAVRATLAGAAELLDGAHLREVDFEPTFHKFTGELVRGFQLHVADRARFRPVAAGTAILWAIRKTHPDSFAWRPPPYEYEWERPAIDLIYGTDRVRAALAAGADPQEIVVSWQAGLGEFAEHAAPFLMYDD